ncbi:MAG: ATP-binding protein [Gammaproteobacteria bacterium]|nr:ATP-binding protein [Gammaproteobacteria bacterium]
MIFRRFVISLAARLVLTGVAMAIFVWLLLEPGYHSAMVLAASALILLSVELWRYVNRTNREVARFLDAARHSDFSQRFYFKNDGSGFRALGETFTDILDRMRERSIAQESEMRRSRALIEHIPVPLMTLRADDSITLQNNAARRLFGAEHVTTLKDLRRFGFSFAESVETAVPGARQLVTFSVEGIEYKLTLATTELIIDGHSERLISLQDIQSELDATQAEAWEDLVRVLTHEIMNSITPVTSLAATATDVVADVREKVRNDEPIYEDLEDLHNAIETVARRSDSLVQFVDSYRQVTRLPPPEKKRIRLADLFETVVRLAQAECPRDDVEFGIDIRPAELDVYADRDLLEPVLINLLRNGWQATESVDRPVVRLSGFLNRRHNVVVEVADNGPGIPPELATKIFVPFFTTRENGSGVGLALARQVMIAHGGFIRVNSNDGGGSVFSLTF